LILLLQRIGLPAALGLKKSTQEEQDNKKEDKRQKK